MSKRVLALLGAVALSIGALACGGEGSTAPPAPEFMQKTAGDDQSGPPGSVLPQSLEVKVTDRAGGAIVGFTVSFSTTAGTVSPQSMDTDALGRARTNLTLPSQSGTVTVTAVAAGVPQVAFTAQAVAPALELTTAFLPAARQDLPYARTVSASGGTAPLSFAVSSGNLPPGLSLETDGTFVGTPSQTGTFPLSIRVSDAAGLEHARALTLQVCEPTEPMAVGEVRVLGPSNRGTCGLFLPSGASGDRYRVALVQTNSQPNPSDVLNASFLVSGNGVLSLAPPPLLRAPAPSREWVASPDAARWRARLEATSREHLRLLEEGEAMARRLGTEGLLRELPAALRAPGAATLPDKLRLDTSNNTDCRAGNLATVLKIAESEELALYQDSTQHADLSRRVSPEAGQRLLSNYRASGAPVIDAYFGGVSDIDGNGKVILVVTPALGGNLLGRVFSGDFFSKQSCQSSNEGEYVYLNVDAVRDMAEEEGFQIGTSVLAHEMKHVSSLYQRLLRSQESGQATSHPTWREEGGAEIAAERAARYAWYFLGGPDMAETIRSEHLRAPVRPGGNTFIVTETFAVRWMLRGSQDHLSRQPNSVVARVGANAPVDYVYSSGWVFLRWLGDAYGGAADGPALADSAFFRRINENRTASGVAGIEAATGRSWEQLMVEFATAAMANGRIEVPREYTSYDFVSAVEMWCDAVDPVDFERSQCPGQPGPPGAFPWPVTTDSQGFSESRGFTDLILVGPIGPSGLRVHDLVSNGSGQGAEINVEFQGSARVVVLRLS